MRHDSDALDLLPGEILLVGEPPRSLDAVESALHGLDCVITAAPSRAAALELLVERDVALVIFDPSMPTMRSVDVARTIRGGARNARVPILVVAPDDQDGPAVLAAYRLGAVELLFEPYAPEVLRAKASLLIELWRTTAQLAWQAANLREHERRATEAALAEEPRRVERSVLRSRLEQERAIAEALGAKNRELERARADLERSNRQLAENARNKDEFIALLAHELRNPLGCISSGIDLLGADDTLAANLQRVQCSMRRQTDHLARLVDDLLDVARIRSGKLELVRQPMALRTILLDAVETTRAELEEREHSLELDLPDPSVKVYGDRVRLTQVFGNVLINAVRYTAPGGTIGVKSTTGGTHVTVVVRDSGSGMDEEMLRRAFDMFSQQRARNGLLAGATGLGVGLALVRRLAELHDGSVSARSDGQGRGTEVEISLPLLSSAAVEVSPPPVAEPEAPPARALRIVLVEDNDDLRELMHELLASWGHQVHDAASASSGLEALAGSAVDLALVDLGLPDMDGYALARRIRQQLGGSCPRLVAVSGFCQRRDRERSADAGFDEHLAKPVSTAELRRVLAAVSPAPSQTP